MLSTIPRILRDQVEAFLLLKAGTPPNGRIVHLGPITEPNGTLSIPADSVGMCVFNIDEERITRTAGIAPNRAGAHSTAARPEVRLNLHVLFAAHFTRYESALDHIGWILGFFQTRHVFSPRNTPGMDPSWSEVSVELHPLNLEQQHQLWSTLRASLLPFICFQVRPVVLHEEDLPPDNPAASGPDLNPGDLVPRIPGRP